MAWVGLCLTAIFRTRLRPVAHAGVDDGERFLPELAGKVGDVQRVQRVRASAASAARKWVRRPCASGEPVVAQNLLAMRRLFRTLA
jgi:hypothetical protein